MDELHERILTLRDSGFGYKRIAKECGKSRDYVRAVLERHGKTLSTSGVRLYSKIVCEVCGNDFSQRSVNQKYCSADCVRKLHLAKRIAERKERQPRRLECKTCGTEFIDTSSNSKYCSVSCREKADRQKRKEKAPKTILRMKYCEQCGKAFVASNGNVKYCSKACGRRHKRLGYVRTQIRDKRLRGLTDAMKNDKTISLLPLVKRDQNKCSICGRDCDLYDYDIRSNGTIMCGYRYPTIDHIIPLSKGGLHTWDNVQLACMQCNSLKGVSIDGEGNEE